MSYGRGQTTPTTKTRTERRQVEITRRIATKAGMPKGFTFTGFRHGGATELGDAGVFDIRPISGHRTLQQTATYNKANQAKARTAGVARQAHIARKALSEKDRT